MNRVERNRLRARCVEGWKPGQSVEVRVEDLEALLDLADQLDVYRPDRHHRIALVHWQEGRTVAGCACASCEGRRAYERHAGARDIKDFVEQADRASVAIEQAERDVARLNAQRDVKPDNVDEGGA